jgi:hypothetical protein
MGSDDVFIFALNGTISSFCWVSKGEYKSSNLAIKSSSEWFIWVCGAQVSEENWEKNEWSDYKFPFTLGITLRISFGDYQVERAICGKTNNGIQIVKKTINEKYIFQQDKIVSGSKIPLLMTRKIYIFNRIGLMCLQYYLKTNFEFYSTIRDNEKPTANLCRFISTEYY